MADTLELCETLSHKDLANIILKNSYFGVRHHEGAGILLRGALHEVGLEPETGLAAAGAADHQHVFVPRRLGILGPVIHGQAFRGRQNDIVGEDGIHEGRDVLRRAPAGGTVFLVLAELPGVLALDVDNQADQTGSQDAHAEIDGVEAGGQRRKRRLAALQDVQGFGGKVCARGQPRRLSQLGAHQSKQKIRNTADQALFEITPLHRSGSL